MFKTLLTTLTLLLGLSSYAIFWPTDKENRQLFAEAYKLSLEISEFCPKEDCLIVGVGRSPTILMDIMERENLANFVRLPLSNFRYNPHNEDKTPEASEHLVMKLTDDEKERLFGYMSTRIRNLEVRKVKRVAFLDFSMTGKSIYAVSEYYKQYLKLSGIDIEVDNIILGKFERYINIMDWAIGYKVDKKNIKYYAMDDNKPLYGALSSQMFDTYALYDKVEIKRGAILKELYNPKRQVYLDALHTFIDKVKELGPKNCMDTLKVFMTR